MPSVISSVSIYPTTPLAATPRVHRYIHRFSASSVFPLLTYARVNVTRFAFDRAPPAGCITEGSHTFLHGQLFLCYKPND